MNKKTPLLLILSTIKGTKMQDGKEVPNTIDGKDHVLNVVYPFIAKPKDAESAGKAIVQWLKDLDESTAAKRVTGDLDGQEIDTAIGTPPVGDGETAIDVFYSALVRGFSLIYQPDMNKRLITKFAVPTTAKAKAARAKRTYNPEATY